MLEKKRTRYPPFLPSRMIIPPQRAGTKRAGTKRAELLHGNLAIDQRLLMDSSGQHGATPDTVLPDTGLPDTGLPDAGSFTAWPDLPWPGALPLGPGPQLRAEECPTGLPSPGHTGCLTCQPLPHPILHIANGTRCEWDTVRMGHGEEPGSRTRVDSRTEAWPKPWRHRPTRPNHRAGNATASCSHQLHHEFERIARNADPTADHSAPTEAMSTGRYCQPRLGRPRG